MPPYLKENLEVHYATFKRNDLDFSDTNTEVDVHTVFGVLVQQRVDSCSPQEMFDILTNHNDYSHWDPSIIHAW